MNARCTRELIVVRGVTFLVTTAGAARRYVDGLDTCSRCDGKGLIYVYRVNGDYYHEGCGLHLGSPKVAS